MEFKVCFHFTGMERKGFIKDLLAEYLKREFVELRELVIEDLNPNYELWNEQYDRLYGERENYNDDDTYHHFIAKKQDDICKRFDNYKKNQVLIMRSDPEESCDLIGIGKEGTIAEGIRMNVTLQHIGS